MNATTEYERFVEEADKYKSPHKDWYYALGLTGEAGEVAELIKKANRVAPWTTPLDRDKLAEELGDTLWYLTRLATWYGVTLQELMVRNMAKLRARGVAG